VGRDSKAATAPYGGVVAVDTRAHGS
jgi:hypothetical protein